MACKRDIFTFTIYLVLLVGGIMNHTIVMGSGAVKIDSGIQNSIGGYTYGHTDRKVISYAYFFQNKESKLKRP
jgi:predicted metalloprotease